MTSLLVAAERIEAIPGYFEPALLEVRLARGATSVQRGFMYESVFENYFRVQP